MNAPFATALAGWKTSAKNKLDAMAASVAEHADAEQGDAWREVIRQRPVLSFGLLAGALAYR